MLFALLFTMAIAQVPPSKSEPAQASSTPVTAPATLPTAEAVPASSSAETAAAETAPEPDPEPEPEPELRTRQVCRYVEVTGQRFPVRSCRTVTIEPEDGQ